MEVLGVDIGGTGIKGAVVDTNEGKLLTERFRIPTPQPATPDAVLQTVKELIDHFDWHGRVGCGFPAVVAHDVIRTASNIDKSWIGLNAGEEIQKATGCPTHLVNDVDAAGLAEMKFGAGIDAKGVTIMLAAGTGLGSALFYDKHLLPNTEFGFVIVNKQIEAEYHAANSVREKEDLDWKTWAGRLNEVFLRLEELFYPDLFILGGGVSKKFDRYSQYFDLNTKLVPAANRNHAGIIGAALAANE
ncbi:MAG: ROK family protein [Ekhidna sp.]|nr:ROK family protein [Ekhidna sp.]